jgi:uncharacterized delta-60 repeat protein
LEDRTLLSDGVLDPSFGVGGLVTTSFGYSPPPATLYPSAPSQQNTFAVQNDGKIVVAGVAQGSVARLNADGSTDTTFGASGLVTTPNFQADQVAVQPADGKIVVSGSTMNADRQEFGLIRLNSNGSLDQTFGYSGLVTIPVSNMNSPQTQPSALAVQADGRIVIAGTTAISSELTGTITNAGSTLATGNLIVITSANHGLASGMQVTVSGVQGDTAANGTWTITVLDANTFVLNGSNNNGLYLTGGRWLSTFTTTNFAVARVYSDGHQDSDFNGNGMTIFNVGPTISAGKIPFSHDGLTAMALAPPTAGQPDGQILVVGYSDVHYMNLSLNAPTFSSSDPQPHNKLNFVIARINFQNGLLDTSFAGGIINLDIFHALGGGAGLADDVPNDVLVQPDGKVVVAGQTWMNDNLYAFPNFGVARFNTDGTLDKSLNGDGIIYTDFSPDFSDAKDIGYSVGIQQDGKIVVAGTTNQTDHNGPHNNGFALVRYNLDGTEDQTFGDQVAGEPIPDQHGQVVTRFPNSSADQATSIATLPNGEILVAGPTNQGGANMLGLALYSGLQTTVEFNQAGYSVQENAGSLLVTVMRSGATQNQVTVNYATSDATAVAGTNYTATSGTLTFGVGQTTQTFMVPIIDAGSNQPTNTEFNITLSNPTGAILGSPSTAMVTIAGAAASRPGDLEFSAANYTINQNGGSITITVTRSNGSSGAVGVTYTTSDGTAVAGTDYTFDTHAPHTLSFAAGVTSQTFTIPILNRGAAQTGNLSFNVSLSTPTGGATLGTPNTAVVTIVLPNFNQQFIQQAYLDLLQRPVDPGGLATWTNFLTMGGTRQQVAAGIESSQEYQQLLVQQLYAQYLHRSADPAGLAMFTAMLAAGATPEQVAAELAGSQEFFQLQGGGTNNGFLAALYQDGLGRPIDPAGQAAFSQFLANGASRMQIAAIVLGSPEYLQHLVQGYYQTLLHRAADSAGLNGFVSMLKGSSVFALQPLVTSDTMRLGRPGALSADEIVIAEMVGSQEYFMRVGQ